VLSFLQIFVLCVFLKFQSTEHRDEVGARSFAKLLTLCAWPVDAGLRDAAPRGRPVQFIETWRPLAQWVKANEAGTLGYEAMVADTDPLKVLVFER
jgi:hypothetical protein